MQSKDPAAVKLGKKSAKIRREEMGKRAYREHMRKLRLDALAKRVKCEVCKIARRTVALRDGERVICDKCVSVA